MARILVTGGAGFIGSWVARELARLGHDIVVMDDLSGGTDDNLFNAGSFPGIEKIAFFEGNCCDKYIVDKLLETFRPDYVYHLAANAREGASFFQPISIVERNTLAYVNVLTSSVKHGVKRMVLFSSMSVYGDQEPPFTEDMPLKPVDIYGLQKANMEQMTKMLSESHGIEYVIIRPHNVFGPYQCMSDIHRNVLAIWMNKILREEPITIYGDGLQERAFSYIEDSLPCYVKAIDPEIPSGTVVNIGGEVEITITDVSRIVRLAMLGDRAGVSSYPVVHLPDRHAEVKYAYTDHTIAKSKFGLLDKVGLVEGIFKMAEWAKKQGPQEWKNTDKLEIPNKLTPEMWREK